MKHDEKACPRCAEAVKKIAKVCKHCGHEFTAEEVAAAEKENKRVNLMAGGLLAVLVLVGVSMCSGDDKPKSVATADSQVTKVEAAEVNLWVNLDLKENPMADSYFQQAGFALRDIGKAIKSGAPEVTAKTEWLQVKITVPSVDRLGNEGRLGLMSLRFPITDMKVANYDVLGDADVLSLADHISISTGQASEALVKWCENAHEAGSADASGLTTKANFCIRALDS